MAEKDDSGEPGKDKNELQDMKASFSNGISQLLRLLSLYVMALGQFYALLLLDKK